MHGETPRLDERASAYSQYVLVEVATRKPQARVTSKKEVKQVKLHEGFKINLSYMNALVDLVVECRKRNVEIRDFGTINNGLQVWFEGFDGDAVIHDFSYGHECGMWETYKMPWDHGDVSVLTTEELVDRLTSTDENNEPDFDCGLEDENEPAISEIENKDLSEKDTFLNFYKELTANLKASVASDIEKEEELYGN